VVFDSHGKSNGTSSASWVHPKLTYANAGHQQFAAAGNSFHYWWGESGCGALLVTFAMVGVVVSLFCVFL
jgi:hypothetical protein